MLDFFGGDKAFYKTIMVKIHINHACLNKNQIDWNIIPLPKGVIDPVF